VKLLREKFSALFSVAWKNGKTIEPEFGLDFCPSPNYLGKQNKTLSLSFPICIMRQLVEIVSKVPLNLIIVKCLILVEIMDSGIGRKHRIRPFS
jgi:hypothetical protein